MQTHKKIENNREQNGRFDRFFYCYPIGAVACSLLFL